MLPPIFLSSAKVDYTFLLGLHVVLTFKFFLMLNPVSGLNSSESYPQISLNITELLEMECPFPVHS